MAIPAVPAAQPASSTATQPRKLTKPPKGRYRLGALANAPHRICFPGRLIEKELAAASPHLDEKGGEHTAADVTVGKVRALQRVKLCEVTLEDVIAGAYTPPLTLRDFEDFVAFREKSAENLYFYLWLAEYEKVYNQHTASERSPAEIISLGSSFATAVDTFFSTSSPLELNVPSDVRREVDGLIREVAQPSVAQPSNEAFLPPAAFAKVKHETYESLAVSFKAFRKQVVRNADRNRGYFAIFLGLLTWALGLIPTVVAAVLDKHRAWRVIGIPLWWFGITVAMGGFGKTCLVIYLFGDNRQLYPWELAAETDASTISTGTGASNHWGTSSDLESGSGFADEKKVPRSPSLTSPQTHTLELSGVNGSSSKGSSPASSIHSPLSDLGYFPLAPASPNLAAASDKKANSTRRSSTTPGGLYFAPAGMYDKLPKSSPTWALFTKQLSPIVARAQQKLVLIAALYGLVVCAITTAICLSVPNK